MIHPKPTAYKPHSWDDIESFYFGLLREEGWQVQPMIELVKHIRSSGLAERLYALTSLDHLIITIYNPIERDREALNVHFDHIKQLWHFKYYAEPYNPGNFERTYNADKGIEKLDSFIEMMKW